MREIRNKEVITETTHPKWHSIFLSCHREKEFRDGALGKRMSPDFNEYYYSCGLPWCKHEEMRVTIFDD